jgi:hypothetical protein
VGNTTKEWRNTVYYDITPEQQEVLLKPLNGSRVAKRKQAGQSLSYLEAWDVKAHMIRVFGFTGWSWDVVSAEIAFEGTVAGKSGGENWNVGYKVIGRLSVAGASYTEAAVGSATLPSRGDAHDMAVKTAESDAFKRAAINLGDQFGLGLYNNGQLVPVVKQTLYGPETRLKAVSEIREAITDLEVVPVMSEEIGTDSPNTDDEPIIADGPVDEQVEEFVNALRAAAVEGDLAAIVSLKTDIQKAKAGDAIFDGKTLNKIADLAVVHAGKVVGAGAVEVIDGE